MLSKLTDGNNSDHGRCSEQEEENEKWSDRKRQYLDLYAVR